MAEAHLVIPGQVIAVAEGANESFLRGHGTYIDGIQLRASVTGVVQRVNKLISVETVALKTYDGQVGDLVVGRVVSIGNARWNVDIGNSLVAALPLSGVHLPGSVQRVRTAADALEMRSFLQEGDLVSAEVHKALHANAIMLHTRSARYGKLENGVMVSVPAKLVPHRKTHYTSICDNKFQILLGCNGMIWIQRNIEGGSGDVAGELAQAEELRRSVHAGKQYTATDREDLARLRASTICLARTLSEIHPESIEEIYRNSLSYSEGKPIPVPQMMLPEHVVQLTESRRSQN